MEENRLRRRSTLCPGELRSISGSSTDDVAARVLESGFEEEKMAFEQSIMVKMTPRVGRCRGSTLTRYRMKRFPNDLRSQDAMWRSAVFSMYSAHERRFCDERNDPEGSEWLSLDGCLVDAESDDRIGREFWAEQKITWEQLSPLQRVLTIAVAAAAAASSKRGNEIMLLQRSLHDRDQALDVMRRKLNDLWEMIFSLQDQSIRIEKDTERGDGVRELEDDFKIERLMKIFSWQSHGQGSTEVSEDCKEKTGEAKTNSVDSPHAPCAAAILELKRRTECILQKEASNVMAAFASFLEKFEGLESSGAMLMHEGIQNKAQGFALEDLKFLVEQASAQINSLQKSLFDLWHTLLPEVLCSVNISPSDLDHYLEKAKTESSVLFPSKQFDTQAWKQWLSMQEHAFEANFLPNLQDEMEEDGFFYKLPVAATEQEERRLSDMSDCTSIASISEQNIWPSVEVDTASAIVAAVKRTVDTIIAPLDTQNSGSKDGSEESVVEKLLSELEIAAEKVVNMESELGRLREYIKECDKKVKDAEEKLAEAVKQGVYNQAEAKSEMVDLAEKLQHRDHTSVDHIHNCQLNFAAKEEEIARLQNDCKQKDAIIKEMTLAVQRSKRLTIVEEICKKKNSTIRRLKEDLISLEEKVSELMNLKIPPSLLLNNEISIPPVMSTNFLFDLDIPSSPDSTDNNNGCQIQRLTLKGNRDLAANGYTSSYSQGYNEKEHVSSSAIGRFRRDSTGNSRNSSPTSGRFRGESTTTSRTSSPISGRSRSVSSTGTSRSSSPTSGRFRRYAFGNSRTGQHSSKVNAAQSSQTRDGMWKNGADIRYTNENRNSGSSSVSQNIKSSRSGNVLSGVDTNSNLKSRRSTPEPEEVQRITRNNHFNKSKDTFVRKR
ncbi:hypothetical protein SUGI_0023030 [Cryptomeria japonica]|nr:hypothetical protein SUGI_0023030 [Cryptomeria japonica]